jgi:hypothetical protein
MRAVNCVGYFRTTTNFKSPEFFSSATLLSYVLGNKQVDAADTCYYFN